ncbi:MAG: four helix bundle protein [Parcubacteria group bacterium]|nr:four helix bundle protein [Parcubacteria group bacterium]
MTPNATNRYRELENRTTAFAKSAIVACQKLPRNRINDSIISQAIRASGSVGANYREANEAVGKKDFVYRLRIARKEAKEAQYWFELLIEANPEQEQMLAQVLREAEELRNILSAIISKVSD